MVLLEVQNLKIYSFWSYFSKAKTKDCDQKKLSVFDKLAIFIFCSATIFLEVSALISLKVATYGFLAIKKTWNFSIFEVFLLK